MLRQETFSYHDWHLVGRGLSLLAKRLALRTVSYRFGGDSGCTTTEWEIRTWLPGNLQRRTLLITRQTCASSRAHFSIINSFLVANYSVYSHKSCELFIWSFYRHSSPIPVAARYKAWVWGFSLTGVPGSNPPGSVEVCLLWMVCLSGTGLCDGLITSTHSPAECGVSDCDREASTMR